MNFLNKMERKLGKYAVRNLTVFLIGCMFAGYLLTLIDQITQVDILSWIYFNGALVMKGQVWRLISWIILPPPIGTDMTSILLSFIMLYFYYSVGTALERTMGAFRYNLYVLLGFLLTDIAFMAATFMGYLTVYLTGGVYYICMSIFLAFAAFYPSGQVLLYFFIPIKMKWMAVIYALMLIYDAVRMFMTGGIFLLGSVIAIAVSLVTFAVFFLLYRKNKGGFVSPAQAKRRRTYEKKVRSAPQSTHHKCAICGRTEQDGEDLTFRFCTKCNGNYEYCQDHLFTHQHIL